MAKSYFTHDSEARNSKKMIDMRSQLDGMTAAAVYGVYWMMVERLRGEENYAIAKNYKRLAFDFRVDEEFIRSVVEDYGLFDISEDGRIIYSHGLQERMAIMETKSAAGKKGAENRWGKNRNEMAQNGTSMAESEKPLGKPDANKIKLNKRSANNSTSISPSLNTSPKSVEGEMEEKEKILFDFVFEKNLAAPEKEYELFWDYNNRDGRIWSMMSDVRKEEAIRRWQQQPAQSPRFKEDFLGMWKKVYEVLIATDAPIEIRLDALSDRIATGTSEKFVQLRCTPRLQEYLEKEEVLCRIKKFFMGYAKSKNCNYIQYIVE